MEWADQQPERQVLGPSSQVCAEKSTVPRYQDRTPYRRGLGCSWILIPPKSHTTFPFFPPSAAIVGATCCGSYWSHTSNLSVVSVTGHGNVPHICSLWGMRAVLT